jgi:cephalosporin hydroxylase
MMNRMDDHADFLSERSKRVSSYSSDKALQRSARQFLIESLKAAYSYNFDFLGMPVFQYPQDVMALQEIIWKTQPDCLIETGVARGGSLVFYAAMLELLGKDGFVIGIDIDTRLHNRRRILEHRLSKRIRLLDGSSIADPTLAEVRTLTKNRRKIMVCLDSNHTHEHVLKELETYAPLVAPGCYCVVFDTIIEMMPKGHYSDRPWDKGNNPKTAVDAFLTILAHDGRKAADGRDLMLEVDHSIERRFLLTAAAGGYLKRP